MPDQDSQQGSPGPEATTTNESDPERRNLTNIKPTGSVDRPTFQQGSGRSCLELAVDNGEFRQSLSEIVGKSGVSQASQHASDRLENNTHSGISRVFEVQEETARRIGQSLHDEASQMLAIVYLELANIARNSPAPTARRIDRVIQHLDSVSEQIRGLSHELRPMVLERHGLLPAIRQLAGGVKKRSGLDVQVIGETVNLSSNIEVNIYRIVQEALSNVVRHADASTVQVRLWQTRERVFCSVRDDGVGYPQASPESEQRYESGLGLVGIYERVDSLGGDCHILSGGRKGMELKLGIPL